MGKDHKISSKTGGEGNTIIEQVRQQHPDRMWVFMANQTFAIDKINIPKRFHWPKWRTVESSWR